ncbi:uncharacterized protein RSE6_14919 [Rhynchosporium secalis]|uniref:NIP2 avirulence protein n=1 Tax=Rhynchosporium secalis TaxID=38038 RepID=A0A1E1MWE2_RHYSE|nr:uncharacterized protein RSE6_14919 [Rhynchosporium secalis]
MKYLSIILACVAATHAYTVVVCTSDSDDKYKYVLDAVTKRNPGLYLGTKGYWNGRKGACQKNGEGIFVDVMLFCRSDPYNGPHSVTVEHRIPVTCIATGSPLWPQCTIAC